MTAKKETTRAQKKTLKRSPATPEYECVIADGLFETGLGSVWISKKQPNGKLSAAVFLLDVFCLGIKNAMLWKNISKREYEMMQMMNVAESMMPIEACCLKKLVQETVAYAQNLGFRPHKDFAAAYALLDDIDTNGCKARFVFGRDGNPFYVPGPDETPKKSERILKTLREHCGEDGFDFITEEDMEDDDAEDFDMTIDDPFEVEELMNALEQELPFKADFEERGWKQLIKEGRVPSDASSAVVVERLSYSGDYGGILCHLAENNVVCSLTHLRVPPRFSLHRKITTYQKRRVKKLKRQAGGA